jgi:uncharacterized membrane protein
MEATAKRNFLKFRFLSTSSAAPMLSKSSRVESIDLLRGLVMIVMALDHVRDYFHADAMLYDPMDLSRTNVFLFFTRFVTHFCAPTFMLLSGTSAYLVGLRKGKKALSMFLLTRGLWLIFLELTIINFGWFFDPQFTNFGALVIWALGISMVLLAGLIHLPLPVILTLSLAMIFGHNLLDSYRVGNNDTDDLLWSLAHQANEFRWGGIIFFVGYPIVPWVGVMALGYCLGRMYESNVDAALRKKFLLRTGVAAILIFIALRYTNWYGDPFKWSEQSSATFTVLSFFNVMKYPPSLLYLLITLGPALVFLSFTEKAGNGMANRMKVIGRVPMFYYLVHLYLIHLAAMIAAEFSGYDWSNMVLTNWVNFEPSLVGYGFSLVTVYAVWIGLVAVLYMLCKLYDRYKQTHKQWWLSYL